MNEDRRQTVEELIKPLVCGECGHIKVTHKKFRLAIQKLIDVNGASFLGTANKLNAMRVMTFNNRNYWYASTVRSIYMSRKD